MAGIALRVCCNVGRRFDLCIDRYVSTTVTSRTGTRTNRCGRIGGACVIHPRRREGTEVGVTDIAGNRGRQMFGRLAESTGAVVTGSTTTNHYASMGIARWLPG